MRSQLLLCLVVVTITPLNNRKNRGFLQEGGPGHGCNFFLAENLESDQSDQSDQRINLLQLSSVRSFYTVELFIVQSFFLYIAVSCTSVQSFLTYC
jgi:hypothetical protein